jgi:transposase
MPPTLSIQDKIEIVLIFGENYKTLRETAEIFNQRHPDKIVHYSTVSRIIQKFKELGSVENCYKVPHEKIVTNEENSINIVLSVVENPQQSTKEIAETSGVSITSVRRILKKNRFYPYRPKFIQVLKDRDYAARFYFSAWIQGMVEEDNNFLKNVLFSDEATFTSNGHVSSQNCRWWASENPNFVVQCKDQYHFKVNVWCGILNSQIVGPFFFRETLNSHTYLNFLEGPVSQFLDDLSLAKRAKLYFQQDGASIHSTQEVTEWLNEEFGQQWIGRYSENPWPARSPDLNPLDFFLWGYLKNCVYKLRPFRNTEHLEECIRNCVGNITPAMLKNVRKEMSLRTILCMERDGGHTEY